MVDFPWRRALNRPQQQSAEQRKAYVEALQRERKAVAQRQPDPALAAPRLAAIDAELDRFAEKPKRRSRETA